MYPVKTTRDLLNHVHNQFIQHPGTSVRMIGILFVRPTSRLALQEITPNLNYFHVRSGAHNDFHLVGYRDWNGDIVGRRIPADLTPFFVETIFNDFRALVEKASKWEYSGG